MLIIIYIFSYLQYKLISEYFCWILQDIVSMLLMQFKCFIFFILYIFLHIKCLLKVILLLWI